MKQTITQLAKSRISSWKIVFGILVALLSVELVVFGESVCNEISLPTTNYVTRTARFWFTHPYPEGPGCVSLRDALQASGTVANDNFSLDLGFMTLPNGYYSPNTVMDVEGATVTALGFYWRRQNRTGELAGMQGDKLPASRLCRARKKLVVEVLAGLANLNLLGTPPGVMTYQNGGQTVNFPSTLLCDAVTVLKGDSISEIDQMTALVRKYNASGQTADFPSDWFECSSTNRAYLRSISRDPTTKENCPGLNDTCQSAVPIVFANDTSLFSLARTRDKANLHRLYSDGFQSPSCTNGGVNAVWKINPSVGLPERPFTVRSQGSNFDALLSVWSGSSANCSNATEVTCGSNSTRPGDVTLQFRTDGTNTFYIVVEGIEGATGKVKLQVSSP